MGFRDETDPFRHLFLTLGALLELPFSENFSLGVSGIILTNDEVELDFPHHCVLPLDLCVGVPEGTPYVSVFFISLVSDLKPGTGMSD